MSQTFSQREQAHLSFVKHDVEPISTPPLPTPPASSPSQIKTSSLSDRFILLQCHSLVMRELLILSKYIGTYFRRCLNPHDLFLRRWGHLTAMAFQNVGWKRAKNLFRTTYALAEGVEEEEVSTNI